MNTHALMAVSAGVMAIGGAAATFLPHEILQLLGASASVTIVLVVQLLGALYLAFAMVNWMAKGSLIGGIYNRPVALGNFAHCIIGALTLSKAVGSDTAQSVIVPLALVYWVFAVAFGLVLFGGGPNAQSST